MYVHVWATAFMWKSEAYFRVSFCLLHCSGKHSIRGQPWCLRLPYCLRQCLLLFSPVCKANWPIIVRDVSASTFYLPVGVLALQMCALICRNFHVDSGNQKKAGNQSYTSLLPSSECVPPQILTDTQIIININNSTSSRCFV